MTRAALVFVRWILPIGIFTAGVLMIALSDDDVIDGAGVGALGIAVMIWLFNVFLRGSIVSNADREREEAARRHFDEHGEWPEDDEKG